MLFYVLKLQNLLGIKIPSKDFKLGLNVCFYTRHELREIFKDLEFEVVDYYEDNWKNNKFKKILLLKNWGRMCFVLQPLNNGKNSNSISYQGANIENI